MYKKSRLYAPRVRGDIDLGLEPSRIGGDLTRRWARIDSPGGRLPGRPDQLVTVESESQNFRVGTRRVDGDRVWHYCFSDEQLQGLRGKFTDGNRIYSNTVTGVCTAALAGATTLSYEPDAAVDVDELAEGYLGCFAPYLTQRIKSNTGSPGGAGNPIVVTFELPLPTAVGAGAWVCGYPNIYRHVINLGGVAANAIYHSVCCVPVPTDSKVTALRWFWGLTWGPTELVVNLWGNLVGRHANMRTVYFGHDGGIVYQGVVGPVLAESQLQHAGRLLYNGFTAATPNGDQLVGIELAP